MNKFNKFYIILAAVATLFSACSETPIDDKSMTIGEVEISASIESQDTKTAIDGVSFSWCEADQIGVYITQSSSYANSCFYAKELSNSNKSALFVSSESIELNKTSTNSVVAYYPYGEGSGQIVEFSVPAIQSQVGETPDHLGAYNFMATPSTSWSSALPSLSFKQLMSKIDFTITNSLDSSVTIQKITMEAKSGKFNSGATLDILNVGSDPSLSAIASQEVSQVGVELSGAWTTLGANESLTASMMLMPVDLSSDQIDITVVTSAGTYTYTKTGNNFTKKVNYDVSLSLKDQEVVASVDYLDFGDSLNSLSFDLRSTNGATDGVLISTTASWLNLSATSIDIPEYDNSSSTLKDVIVTASRDGLTAGTYTSEIVVSSPFNDIVIPVSLVVTAAADVNTIIESCDDDLEFQLVSCQESTDGIKVSFTVTNNGTSSETLKLYASSNSYSFDDRGSLYSMSYVSLAGTSNTYSISSEIQPGVTIQGYYTVSDVSSLASVLRYSSITTSYNNKLIFKDVPITGRTATSLPEATTTGTIVSCSDDIEFTLLSCKSSTSGMKINFRMKNTGSSLISFKQYASSSSYAYDDRGSYYSLAYVSLGDCSAQSYSSELYLPSGVDVNGYIIVSGVSDLSAVLKYISISTNYSNKVVMKNINIEGATATDLPTATTTGTITSCSDDIEFTLLSCKSSTSGMKVSFRMKNTSSSLISFKQYASSYSYAYDDRGSCYSLAYVSLGDCSAQSYSSELYLPPGVDVNGYIIVSGVSDLAAVLKYISISTNYSNKVVMKNINIEGATATDLPTATTTGTITSCSDDIDFTLLSCKSSTSGIKISYRLKNTSSSLLSLKKYATSSSSAYDNAGNSCSVSYVSLGDGSSESYSTEFYLPPYVDVNGYIIISGVSDTATAITSVTIQTNYSNNIKMSNIQIEGR